SDVKHPTAHAATHAAAHAAHHSAAHAAAAHALHATAAHATHATHASARSAAATLSQDRNAAKCFGHFDRQRLVRLVLDHDRSFGRVLLNHDNVDLARIHAGEQINRFGGRFVLRRCNRACRP